MKALKYLVVSVIAITLLVFLAAVILIFTVDPNRLKPILEDEAAKKGLALKMTGDIAWQLYPKLGLSLGQIQLSHKESGQLMTSVKQSHASVQLMPLFKQQILVDGVELEGLELFYTIGEDGVNVWASLLDSVADQTASEAPNEAASAPELSIQKVRVTNSLLQYHDKQNKQQARISLVKLNADGLTLDGKAFPLDISIKADYNDLPSLQIDWQSDFALDLIKQSVHIPLSKMNVSVGGRQFAVGVSTTSSWADTLSSEGVFNVQAFDLPALLKVFSIAPPQTQKSTALKKVSAAFDYKLEGERLGLNNISVGVDDFTLTGQVNVVSFSSPNISVNLKGTSIVLDDYLPPAKEGVSGGEASAPVASVAPVKLPMDTLKSLHFDAKIFIDSVSYSGMPLRNNQIYAAANKGVIRLDQLSSEVAEGTFYMDALLNATGSEATLAANVTSKKINVGSLLKTFADLDQLNGLATTDMTVSTHGKTDKELVDNIIINGNVGSEGLNITPFNIEQQFCNAIALLQQERSPSHDWPKKTELEPVSLKFNLANNTLKVDSLSAEIAHLLGAADGSVNLATGTFDIPISLSLGDFAGDIKGCLPIADKWRTKKLPLRCKGNLNDIGAKTCLPDTKLIGNLIKDKVTEKAKAKIDEKKQQEIDKAEQKAKDKARELLKKQLGDEGVKEAEDSLRGLFKKFKDK